MLATAGTIVGLLLAYAGVRLLLAFGAATLPRLERVPFDARVLGFALAALLVTALLVGLAPALRLAGTSLKALMNEGGRSSTAGTTAHRMLKTMTVAEIALAITLVAGAGWLVRSFGNLGSAESGFVPQGRLVFDVLLPPARIFPPPGGAPVTAALVSERVVAWTQQISDRLRGDRRRHRSGHDRHAAARHRSRRCALHRRAGRDGGSRSPERRAGASRQPGIFPGHRHEADRRTEFHRR